MIIIIIKIKAYPQFFYYVVIQLFSKLAERKKPRKLFKRPWYDEFLKMQNSCSYKDTFLFKLRYRADHAYHFSYSYLKPAV